MAIWGKQAITFDLDVELTAHPVATLTVNTPVGTLFVMAEAVRTGGVVTLVGLHVQSDRVAANDVGTANVMVVVQAFMEMLDVDELVVAGGIRTTGANPGKTPRRVRFTRRPAA